MQYRGKKEVVNFASANIIDILAAVLGHEVAAPEAATAYCKLGIDYLERECQDCSLCNYGRDCHNNEITR